MMSGEQPRARRIYLASSWRNPYQPEVLDVLLERLKR